MLQLTLNFDTPAEAIEALTKLNGGACTCAEKTTVAPAPAAPVTAPAPEPAPTVAPAPATAPQTAVAPPPATAPAPAAAPAAPSTGTVQPANVTAEVVNRAAVNKATAMGDNGAGIVGLLAGYNVKGVGELPVDKLAEFLDKINALGVTNG